MRKSPEKQISLIPKVGMDLILTKAAVQRIFMHAVHINLSTIFTSLQT